MRAGGGDQEEPERDAAGLEVLPQRVGDVGPPDRPRHPHDRGASAVHVHLVVPVAAAMAVTRMVLVVVVADVPDMTAVRAWCGEEERRARRSGCLDVEARGGLGGREQRRRRCGNGAAALETRRRCEDGRTGVSAAVRYCIAAATTGLWPEREGGREGGWLLVERREL